MTETPSLDPRSWSAEEVEDALADDWAALRNNDGVSATGTRGAVVGSTGPFAQLAGRKALEAGGSSVDAALATSFTQIALASGSWVSYAGLFAMVHFDAKTSEVVSLSGGFATFAGEDDPLTIPVAGEASGRTALVPGFFGGAWAAHQRFGRLPWATLLEPAIYIAEEGFPVTVARVAHFTMRADLLQRTPEGRDTFLDENGALPSLGSRFAQPALAKTLRRVADDGVDYLYRGEWAEHFVDIVQREGGKATREDLASYAPIWSEPLRGHVRGFEILALAEPDHGGAALIEGLQMADVGGVGNPATSGEALAQLATISRLGHALGFIPPSTRVTREHAEEKWNEIEARLGRGATAEAPTPGSHSDFALSADAEGNVTTVCHSINTSLWGSTGIFVDGISVPDAACFQQQALAQVAPGGHLPMPTNPAIVMRDGKPVLASSSIGAGLVEVTLQCVHAFLSGASVDEIVRRPLFHLPDFVTGDSIHTAVESQDGKDNGESAADAAPPSDSVAAHAATWSQTLEDTFDEAVVEDARARGLNAVLRPATEPTLPRGYWGAIAINSDAGTFEPARTRFLTGRVQVL